MAASTLRLVPAFPARVSFGACPGSALAGASPNTGIGPIQLLLLLGDVAIGCFAKRPPVASEKLRLFLSKLAPLRAKLESRTFEVAGVEQAVGLFEGVGCLGPPQTGSHQRVERCLGCGAWGPHEHQAAAARFAASGRT